MQLIVDAGEILKAFEVLKRGLRSALGKPHQYTWRFPGGGGHVDLDTYEGADHLTVAISKDPKLRAGAPILIRVEPIEGKITPTVEVNIPIKDKRAKVIRDPKVNGCFARDEKGRIWLCHRGVNLRVQPRRIPRDVIHRHFQKWLVTLHDGNQEKMVIPVASLESADLSTKLSRFGRAVRDLKKIWTDTDGNEEEVNRQIGWFDKVNFSPSISKIFERGETTYKYNHGPIQEALQQYLKERLAGEYRTKLNNRIDLGITRNDRLLAIFEVKTGLGNQIYSGIGQLLVYRHHFAPNGHVLLFLVLPESVLETEQQRSEMSSMLQALGMTLVLQKSQEFHLEDGRALHEVLDPKWLG